MSDPERPIKLAFASGEVPDPELFERGDHLEIDYHTRSTRQPKSVEGRVERVIIADFERYYVFYEGLDRHANTARRLRVEPDLVALEHEHASLAEWPRFSSALEDVCVRVYNNPGL